MVEERLGLGYQEPLLESFSILEAGHKIVFTEINVDKEPCLIYGSNRFWYCWNRLMDEIEKTRYRDN